ncbi:Phosphatidylglycerol/phosphatidylinositol transfer protein [Clonorchis sinensis]|uniref:Phosphatidylglycerol/phosphatidylinositol transfer protein n=1 Tax=Clonorchis sinensis TaxID=79923 RepID=A0A8T1N1I9_CLOSI|nr:Phosphatidylglycerol/phosphatidylinositol transfer protein [Clonorchis sinensis]
MNLVTLFVSGVLFNLSRVTYAVDFRDCGSSKARVISVTISPCNPAHCTLRRGQESSVDILFTTTQRFTVGAARVQAGSPSGFRTLSITASEVCDLLTPGCPVLAGRTYSFKYTGEVPKRSTVGPMTIRWEMLDSNLIPFLCAEFDVQIE